MTDLIYLLNILLMTAVLHLFCPMTSFTMYMAQPNKIAGVGLQTIYTLC